MGKIPLPAPAAVHVAELDSVGYTVVRDVLPPATLTELETAVRQLLAVEGEAAGVEFRQEQGVGRLAALVGKHAAFERLVADPALLCFPAHLLGADRFKLSSLNARVVPPAVVGDTDSMSGAQPLHADMMGIEDDQGAWLCNIIIPLAPYNDEMGPLRVVPRSAAMRKLPAEAVEDPSAPHPQEVIHPFNTSIVTPELQWQSRGTLPI